MYDPQVGRFLEEDQSGFAAGDANLFRYVGNSPTNATDPSGLEEVKFPNAEWKEKKDEAYPKGTFLWVSDKSDWTLSIPKISADFLDDGKVGYVFNIIVQDGNFVAGKDRVIVNSTLNLGILDQSTPEIGPIVTKDNEGKMPTGETGESVYSIDTGHKALTLDVNQRGALYDKNKLIITRPHPQSRFPELRKYPVGNSPSGRLVCATKKDDVTGSNYTATVTSGDTKNASWIIYVERSTKTFGYAEVKKGVELGQHYISDKEYNKFLGELGKNAQKSVSMHYTYFAVDWKKAKNLPEELLEAFFKRLSEEYKVPAAHIASIKDAIKTGGMGFKAPDYDEQILMDGMKNPIR